MDDIPISTTVTSEIGFHPKRTAESFPPRAKALCTDLTQIWLSVMVGVRHFFEAAISHDNH